MVVLPAYRCPLEHTETSRQLLSRWASRPWCHGTAAVWGDWLEENGLPDGASAARYLAFLPLTHLVQNWDEARIAVPKNWRLFPRRQRQRMLKQWRLFLVAVYGEWGAKDTTLCEVPADTLADIPF
jgi:hypothetical protein